MYLSKLIFLLSLIIIVKGCEDKWSIKMLKRFKQRSDYKIGRSFEVFSELSKSEITSHLIENSDDCVGLTTGTNETIVLHCPRRQQKEPGCFEIIPLKPSSQNNTEHTGKQEKICGQILEVYDDHIIGCVIGLKTRDSSVIIFRWISISSGLTASVPNNGPPDRMK